MRQTLRSITAVLFVVLYFVCTAAWSQDPAVTGEDDKSNITCRDSEHAWRICNFEIRGLEPPLYKRFGRGFEYKFERQEQPAFASGSTSLNPEHYLNQHSLTFRFSELFSTTADRVGIFKQIIEDNHDRIPNPSDKSGQKEWCGTKIISCLVKGSGWWKRPLAGLSVSGSIAEWQAIQQGASANENFFPHYGKGAEIDFDPKGLFITANDWKSVADAVGKVDPQAAEQLSEALQPRHFVRVLEEILIPQFQFKRITQFDFVKTSGVLIPNPFPESGLNNYSVTWNLKNWIADGATRRSRDSLVHAYDAYEAALNQKKHEAQESAKICITISGQSRNFINVPTTFASESCQALAKSLNATQYALGCSSANSVQGGSSLYTSNGQSVDGEPVTNPCKLN